MQHFDSHARQRQRLQAHRTRKHNCARRRPNHHRTYYGWVPRYRPMTFRQPARPGPTSSVAAIGEAFVRDAHLFEERPPYYGMPNNLFDSLGRGLSRHSCWSRQTRTLDVSSPLACFEHEYRGHCISGTKNGILMQLLQTRSFLITHI
jgi:hypothetical protein